MINPPTSLKIGPDLLVALARIDAGSKTTIYGSMLCDEAERLEVGSITEQTSDPFAPILSAINALIKSLLRSNLTADKIQNKIAALPDPAGNFLRLNLMRNLGREIDTDDEDWTNPDLREELIAALRITRAWFRNTPGPARAEPLHRLALSAAYIYEQITGTSPGLGGSDHEDGYKTPFEELWLATLRHALPNATYFQAREIYRVASGRS
jgi:hypothetical protein